MAGPGSTTPAAEIAGPALLPLRQAVNLVGSRELRAVLMALVRPPHYHFPSLLRFRALPSIAYILVLLGIMFYLYRTLCSFVSLSLLQSDYHHLRASACTVTV